MNDKSIEGALDLMGERLDEEKISLIIAAGAFYEVSLLNGLFDCKWSWQITDTGPTLDEKAYAISGRLLIPGLGFRDGIGTGTTPCEASNNALKDALAKVGNLSAVQNKVDDPIVQGFKASQLERMKKLKARLNITKNTELNAYVWEWQPEFTGDEGAYRSINIVNIDTFMDWLEREKLVS